MPCSGRAKSGCRKKPLPETGPHDLFFLFKGQPVFIKKYLYFHEGTVPLEQQLLIKYGELVKKQELQDSAGPVDYRRAAGQIRRAAPQIDGRP